MTAIMYTTLNNDFSMRRKNMSLNLSSADLK